MKQLLTLLLILVSVTSKSQVVDVLKAGQKKDTISITYSLRETEGVSFAYLVIDGQQQEEISISEGSSTYTTTTLHTNGSFYFLFDIDGRKIKTNIYQLKILNDGS